MSEHKRDEHWLVRPATVRLLWRVAAAVLALTIVAQLMFPVKGAFGVDGWFGFGAVFGFLSCVAMVFVAKSLGLFLKRDDDYYARGDNDA